MQAVVDVVRGVRNARAEFRIPAQQPVEAVIAAAGPRQTLEEETPAIKALAKVEPLRILSDGVQGTSPRNSLTFVLDGAVVTIPLEGVVDLQQERQRLERELADCQSTIQRLEQHLQDQEFLGKAPEAVVERERQRLESLEERRGRIEELLSRLVT
jgi:valyl-tRNA synthetase